ncbi:MAG: SusC/RagA family TonB-linked outer membrane protein [Rickettsiaceae bacterium]|nr:MAG: SusC/RagA family TonB-linked outer membrane protein [Rickettsiaceae bacterium]
MRKLQLFKWQRIGIASLLFILFSTTLFAQSTVSGKIVDERGEPLTGANIRVTGTTIGATADINGSFRINAPAGARSITISFVGYANLERPITAGANDLGSIRLTRNSNNLQDVVVVGYGTLRRQDVTGTVATVDAKTLQEIPASNVFEQLKGRVAGLDVTSNASGTPIITIRGNRTIGASPGTDGPLIILDGQPYYNSIENIDPNNIKSVDVLKGASATAIYGSRASGGVLLITTNRGRVGQTVTSYDSYVGISTLQGNLKTLNGQQYNQLKQDALLGSILQNNGTSQPYPLTPAEIAGLAAGVNTDWVKQYTKPSVLWDQSLRLSSGTEKTQINLGLGYRTQDGLEPNINTKRINLTANIDHRVNKFFKVGTSIQTTLRLINTGGSGQIGNAQWLTPLASPYNPDGSVNYLPFAGSTDATTLSPLVPKTIPDAYYNYTRGLVNNDIVYAELNPINHFTYRYTINYNYSQSLQGVYNGVNGGSILTINNTNASTTNNYQYRIAQEHLLTYDNTFADKHRLNIVAAFTKEKQHAENSSSNVTNIPSNAIRNNNLNLGTFVSQNGTYSEYSLLGVVGRVNYAYNGKYDLTASYRADANSALAAGHQWTTYPSVGLGWVISNEEFMKRVPVIDNLKLRGGYGITSTIASVQPYEVLGLLSNSFYQFGGASAGNSSGVVQRNLPNYALTWQRSHETNIALDFGLFKNRLTGSIEVYNTKTTGIILSNILPPTTGATSQRTNLGTSADRGLEITLSSINIQNKGGFSWSTDYNMGFNRERIVYLPNGAQNNIGAGLFVGSPLSVIYDVKKTGIWQLADATQTPYLDSKGNPVINPQTNQPYLVSTTVKGQTSPTQYPGQIRVQDVNGDGKIDASDNQIIGSFQPQYSFGMTNRFSYKNFDLSIVIQGRMKFTTIVPYVSSSNSGLNGWQFLNLGRHNQPVIDYWTPTNPTNAFPEPNANFQSQYYSTLQYYDGSWIRAKSINLGYNIPTKLLHDLGISSLRVYANVTNPFFIYAPIRNHGFSVPDAESIYNVTGSNAVSPASVSASGNIGGYDPNNANNSPYRGLGISPGLQTRDFIFGINARF